jgi:hypothetical protein
VQVRQGRLNFTTLADNPEGAPVMTGIFSVLNYPAVVLFDSSASHSFISAKFSAKCQLTFYHTNGGITISTPGGRVATYQLNRQVPIKLGSLVFKTTLLIMGLESMDIILGASELTLRSLRNDFCNFEILLRGCIPLDDVTSILLHQIGI